MTTLHQAYSRRRPILERAADRLRSLLQDVVGRIEDRRLVRVELDTVRPKSPGSLALKAQKAGWNPDEALSTCPDLVGGRVVCNNIEDVYRFEALLQERLPFEATVERQDYIHTPKDGYRALHLNFRLDVGTPLTPHAVPCEVQIRSRLQDAWAKLSHADIYKHDDLPLDLLARAVDLSRLLAAAEEIAADIRTRVRHVTQPPQEQPTLTRPSAAAVAYIFKDVFGRAPADYVVTMALRTSDDLHIVSLEGLPAILKARDFRDNLNLAYSQLLPFPMDPESFLLAGLHALAAGEGAALRYVREQAKAALDEIDDIATRELLSELPATAEQLIDAIDDPRGETDITHLAKALGATDNCPYCNATVVDAYGFAEAAMYHYDLPEDVADREFERIQEAVLASGVDTGSVGELDACSHCASVLRNSA